MLEIILVIVLDNVCSNVLMDFIHHPTIINAINAQILAHYVAHAFIIKHKPNHNVHHVFLTL